jgi:hypothetical protein
MLIFVSFLPGRVGRAVLTCNLFMKKFIAVLTLMWMAGAPASAFTKRIAGGASYTTNGSSQDVQQAINNASVGDTVLVPSGDFQWTSQISISKPIHLKGDNTHIARVYLDASLVAISASPTGSVELSGFEFDSNTNTSGKAFIVEVSGTSGGIDKPPLIHDCTFRTGYEYAVKFGVNTGVIYHCKFYCYSRSLGGITFVVMAPDANLWNQPSTLGAADHNGDRNVYVEDCEFHDAETAMSNFDDNSRIVWRHNLMQNASMSSHGQETSIWGARHFEIYGNRWVWSGSGNAWDGTPYPLNMNYWLQIRGGSGVVFDNEMDEIPWGKPQIRLDIFNIRRLGQVPCQTGYPAAHQVGQGWNASSHERFGNPVVDWDGTGAVNEGVWFWGNTGSAIHNGCFICPSNYNPDECGNGQEIGNYLQQGRDYHLEAKPGYTAYAYPHPLRGGGGGGGPTPTPTATPTPAPTATPPQPTPTPTPVSTPTPPHGNTYRTWLDTLGQWIEQHPAHPDHQ